MQPQVINRHVDGATATRSARNLNDIRILGRELGFRSRTEQFSDYTSRTAARSRSLYGRCINSPTGREVTVTDPVSRESRIMLMFGSNNYLGLANHPYVRERVARCLEEFGAGVAGPPLLNGQTRLHAELEERLAALKGAEQAILFSTGYSANVGLMSAICTHQDLVVYDVLSHASLCDGLKLAGVQAIRFRHNDVDHLRRILHSDRAKCARDVFVCTEGVFSMDGDIAPLHRIADLCAVHKAVLVLDDAHGTGVIGANGRGTAAALGVEDEVDITMGTFSKAFGVAGGFVAASKDVVNYLRFFARAHMFSAALPPMVVAAVLAGLDVMEQEPQLIERLRANVDYAISGLEDIGQTILTRTPIIAIRVPESMDIYRAARQFHEMGLFINPIAYPAVPVKEQRFRISLSAEHTFRDIDRLVDGIETVMTQDTEVSAYNL